MPLSGIEEFFTHRSIEIEPRLQNIENYLARLTGRGPMVADQTPSTSPTRGTTVIVSGNGNGGGSGQIPESRITWDDFGGHDHDGIAGRLVPLAGDVTGDNEHALVVQIEGKPIPAPAAGNDLKYIRWNNAGNTFEYAAATSGAPLIIPQRTVTVNASFGVTDTAIWTDATAGNIALTLPAASALAGRVLIGKKLDASVNTVTLTPAGADTIDNGASAVISVQYTALMIVSDGVSKWWLI